MRIDIWIQSFSLCCMLFIWGYKMQFVINNTTHDNNRTGESPWRLWRWFAFLPVAWRQTPETGSGVVAFTDWVAGLKCQNTFIGTHLATYSNMHTLPGVWCLSPVQSFMVCLKLRLTHVFDFKWRHGQLQLQKALFDTNIQRKSKNKRIT